MYLFINIRLIISKVKNKLLKVQSIDSSEDFKLLPKLYYPLFEKKIIDINLHVKFFKKILKIKI